MKKSKMKLLSGVLSVALLASAGTIAYQSSNKSEAQAVTQTTSLTIDQLREKALQIIPGTIVKEDYDYDLTKQVVEFDILDKNGIKREIELEVATGKVYDIDYDYDEQGNRFINQALFEVNKTYEESQAIALQRVPGKVLNHKQDVERGLFVYEFIIQGNNGLIYEVDVETKTGSVIKLEIDDDYNPYKYNLGQVVLPQTQVPSTSTTNQTTGTPQTSTEAQLRQQVLAKFPGTVIKFESDYDDGIMEYEYKIRQNNGKTVKVEINQFGYITDVDY